MVDLREQSAAPVRVEGVRKTYRLGRQRIEALRGCSMNIERPGFYAIMGASGSGKSTLLHLLCGLDQPDEGRIIVAGHHLETMSERALTAFRRQDVGIIFQQFNLIPTLTALDNVLLPAMFGGVRDAAMAARGESLLERLGMQERRHHRPDALSGGEQQRVAIARALLFSPTILLADEPTGNLDSSTSEHLWSLLGELAAEQQMTIIMVTHEPIAAAHCQRVFVLRDGLIQGSFDVQDMGPSELAACYQQHLGATR